MRVASILATLILLGWGAAALAQLWFEPFTWTFFIKLSISCVLVAVIGVVVALIKREYLDETRQRKDKYID